MLFLPFIVFLFQTGGAGEIPSLFSKIAPREQSGTVAAGSSVTLALSAAVSYLVITTGATAPRMSAYIAFGRNNNSAIISEIVGGTDVEVTEATPGVKIKNKNANYSINYFVIRIS